MQSQVQHDIAQLSALDCVILANVWFQRRIFFFKFVVKYGGFVLICTAVG